MPRSVLRRVSTLTLGLALSLAVGGCRTATSPDGKQPKPDKASARAKVELPAPLELPDNPAAVSWVAQPNRAIALLEPYSPQPLNVPALAQMGLMQLTDAELAEQIAGAINLAQPFASLVLDSGEEVYRLSLQKSGGKELRERLAGLEAVGKFGAVRLPANPNLPSSREWLAWIDDDDGGALVLATSEAGLVTGRVLAETYADKPVFFSLDLTQLALPIEVPVAAARGEGTLDALRVEVDMIPGQDPLADLPIAAGTLAGLLDGEGIVAGVSTRYAEYDLRVREATTQINAQVRQLPFLVRGIGEDLAASFNTLARTWDGRSLVALGPAGHLRAAYGANDVDKSRVAMIRLLQKVSDNVSIIRNFTNQVPKMSLKRRVAKGDGQEIELFVIHQAQSVLPSDLRPLLDSEGRLKVAMAWSERAGGGLFVIGPDAANNLAAWLDSTASSPKHDQTREQLAAASFAANPDQVGELLGMTPETFDLARVLALGAEGPRWRVNVTPRGPERYTIDLRTPGAPKPARAR